MSGVSRAALAARRVSLTAATGAPPRAALRRGLATESSPAKTGGATAAPSHYAGRDRVVAGPLQRFKQSA
jgi:hypothetical protein